ncbi:MAG TPA: DNA replication and repair protein RecF [Parasegetibacter sp.]
MGELHLERLSLVQFKNYLNREFRFGSRVVGIVGNNGIGKTNLLDAIYYLCFTRSYFSKSDAGNVNHGSSGFRIAGQVKKQLDPVEITCVIRGNGRKEFALNGEIYQKFSHHIGKFTCVFIAPDDVVLLTGTSEERRKYIDTILSQLDPAYLNALIDYNRILQQRNSLLKDQRANQPVYQGDFGRGNFHTDLSLLEIYDQQLAPLATVIHAARKKFLDELIPRVNYFYDRIAGKDEQIEIAYISQLNEKTITVLLNEFRQKDLLLQRTNAGIHKDDIDFLLRGQSFRNTASQGQRKSLLIALKLAEFEVLTKAKGFAPLLLLDDIFEKLDESRMTNLLNFVCVENKGQIFITDTHPGRLTQTFEKINVEFDLINLSAED